jgi:single-stranded-DNA-specific exonuclease
MEKKWEILIADDNKVKSLQSVLKINQILCKILVERGIETFEESKKYFRPQLQELHDPWLMKDMDIAVDRIISAYKNQEKILVYGDYDVDGTASVACLYLFLQKSFNPALMDFYIPNRYREGYGISKIGIDFAKENNFTLIVSLDCGIKSVELISYASGLGIDFIVCDHHLPDHHLPPAVAILNPKQKDCKYPFKELCGCGVGLKLITALAQKLDFDSNEPYEYLDLVATAIAADIVPVNGENRILAYYGLQKVNKNPNNGIKALIQVSTLKKELSINDLVFLIAPRVNAAGRMDDARKAVQMFISKDFKEAEGYAAMLHSDNTDRKEADLHTTEEAVTIIESDQKLINRKSTVVFQPHWHKGVVGIVASRLIEKYYRPTIVLTKSGEVLAGSARSVSGFNLYEAIHACREHLIGYGGHFAAAGMSLLPHQVEAFSLKFEEIVSATIQPDQLIPKILIDGELSFSDITISLYNIIRQMEPFGPGNTRPVFIARNVSETGFSKIVKEQHIRFSLKHQDTVFSGIGFKMAEKFPLLKNNLPLDIVFTIDENEWNGQKQLQLKMIDFRLTQLQQ